MKRLLIILSTFVILASCMWDYDTIEMEKQQFPEVIELISGNFLRHSPEYHEWRIEDREKWLKHYPDSLELYDDMAVSYSKLENNTKAIELMLAKDSISPGLYKTYANLGTFYIHDKQFEKGLEFIDKAIEINPDAHFGREVYQKYLVEYVMEKKRELSFHYLPLDPSYPRHPEGAVSVGFHWFLVKKEATSKNAKYSNTRYSYVNEFNEGAIKGVTGMMKFGNYDSPILLEVLGDLLVSDDKSDGARQLATMAYIQAANNLDSTSATKYYEKVANILYIQQVKEASKYSRKKGDRKIYALKEMLTKEIEKGDAFYNEIRADEIKWISQGLDPEVEFFKKYYEKELVKKTLPAIEADTADYAIVKGKKIIAPEPETPWIFILIPIAVLGGAFLLLRGKKKK